MKITRCKVTVELENVMHEELYRMYTFLREKKEYPEAYLSGKLEGYFFVEYLPIIEIHNRFIIISLDSVTTIKCGGYCYEKILIESVVK